MNCRKAIDLMHEYLDDINKKPNNDFEKHINNCKNCNLYYRELKMTENALKQEIHADYSNDIVENVLIKISAKKNKSKIKIYSRKYPAVFAASIFLVLFSISMISYLVPSDELKIVSDSSQEFIVSGNEVIIPVGEDIQGDILIENGILNIQGEVNGNVTVVNGELLMASANNIDGNTNQIDQFFELLWYRIKSLW